MSAVRSVVIGRPFEPTRTVHDIELLEPLERKARAVEVHPDSATSGWYRIHSGGFVVTPVDQHSCRVTHYEDYVPPRHLRWMHPVLVAYM